ncbi:MAG: DUF1648 domain-containing protein [Thermoguttaceae bacterium]
MKTFMRSEWPFWILLAAMFLMSAAAWSVVPDRIPVHWNAHGQIDGYGGKWEGLLLLPTIVVGLYLLMLAVPRIDPGRANYESFKKAYWVIRLVVLAYMAVLHATILLITLGHRLEMNRIVLLSSGVLLLILGSVLGKVRPNWFVGVRTPWTLSSKQSWTRSQRAGGWMLITAGIVTLPAAFLPAPWNLALFLGTLLLGTLWLVLYSYLIWRHDPERTTPSDTTPADE